MSLKFHILASGSKGNSTIIQTENTTILLDCGYLKRYLTKAFEDLNITTFDALLITHSHSDHIQQLKSFQHLPIYTAQNLDVDIEYQCEMFDEFFINDLKITVLPLSHDCENTIGFLFEHGEESLVYICDTGYVSNQVQNAIKNKTYYVMESNHDLEMLMNSKRPLYLKQRIASDTGHLCNEDCAQILANCIGEKTKAVYLGHISDETNTRQKAYETTRAKLNSDIAVFTTKQDEIISGGKQ